MAAQLNLPIWSSWCATQAGFELTDLVRIGVVIGFAVALWRLAVAHVTARLIDDGAGTRLDRRSSRARRAWRRLS